MNQVSQFAATFQQIQTQVGRVLLGQEEVVEHVLIGIFARGHVLLEGVPGLGKTLLVRSLDARQKRDLEAVTDLKSVESHVDNLLHHFLAFSVA